MFRSFAILALVLASAAPHHHAWAADRTIGILNLSQSADSADIAAKARELINKAENLRCIGEGELSRALEGEWPSDGPYQAIVERATQAREASAEALQQFRLRESQRRAEEARALLLQVPPGEKANPLLAQVSFQMALLHLRAQNLGLAIDEFHLMMRMHDPGELDPVRYPPSVIDAFLQARRSLPQKGSAKVTVTTTFDGADIFVDGTSVGKSPAELALLPGNHIISVAAPEFQAQGRVVVLEAKADAKIRFDLTPRALTLQALEARLQAAQAELSEGAVETAARRAAEVVDSDVVLLLLPREEQTLGALYFLSTNRRTTMVSITEDLGSLLALVQPVARPVLLTEQVRPPSLPWYRRAWGIATLSGGAALLLAAIFSATNDNSTPPERRGVPTWEF